MTTKHSDWARLLKHTARLSKSVQRQTYRYLSQYVSVADLVSETLHYASEHREQWEKIPDERLHLYLRKVARWIILNHAERVKTRREVAVTDAVAVRDAMPGGATDSPSPSRLLHKGEKILALDRVFARLKNQDYKQVLRLVWLEGFSIPQPGERMKRSPEVAKVLLWRALEACRRIGQRESFAGFRVSGETT